MTMHAGPLSLSPKRFALLLLLAFMACASPALASPFGLLTGGSVEFMAAPFRFVSGSATDTDGNTFSFSWIPLFFSVQGAVRGVSFASSNFGDSDVASGSAMYQGHSYPNCDSTIFPGIPHPTPCAFIRAGVSMGGPPPPFDPGATSTVIAGSFTIGLDVLLFTDRLGQLIDEFQRSGSGHAVITLVNDPLSQNWLFKSGTGMIDPVPEPATLLLLGGTFAGIGLARWSRRY
jgi:hypothetical protein